VGLTNRCGGGTMSVASKKCKVLLRKLLLAEKNVTHSKSAFEQGFTLKIPI